MIDKDGVWYASTYTEQVSSFPNTDAWTIVEGWLIPRKLAKGNDVGLTVRGERWKDYRFEFQFVIRRIPGPVSALALGIGFPDNERAASVTRMSVTFTCADLRKALTVLNGGGGK